MGLWKIFDAYREVETSQSRWECNSNFIRLSKTLETRMVPAFFAFLRCRFGMMEIGRICGKVGKNLVRELVKSFTNF